MRYLHAAAMISIAALGCLACSVKIAAHANAAIVVAPQPGASSRFVRDPARLRAKQDQIIAATRAENPQAAQALARAFQGDIVAQVAPAFRPFGFSTDDVIDMTAAYWVTAWEAANGTGPTRTDPAVARGVRAQLAKGMQGKLAGMSDADKQDIADSMLLQALIADARVTAAARAGAADRQAVSDAIWREANTMLRTDLRQVDMTVTGFRPRPGGGASAGEAAGPATAGSTGGGGRTPRIAGYYFRPTFGMGGAISHEPLVMFDTGEYVELDDVALADMDAAADKARAPIRWGRWRKQGSTWLLTDSKGRTEDYRLGSGSFFPAYLPSQGPKLSGTYKNTSGGGNYALGGGVTTLAIDAITFHPDGSFSQGRSMGAIAPNAAAGGRRSAAGRWRIDGSTLELAYADGRRSRKTMLWSASGTPPRPSAKMVFIGGDQFLRED